jgi:hypothetical protein
MVAAAALSNILGSAVSIPFAQGIAAVTGFDLFIFAMFGFFQVALGLSLYMPCSSTRMTAIIAPPNRPRQNRMVQESNGSSRVKNGAVLHATAAATTRAIPLRCCDCAPAIPLILSIAGVTAAATA